MRTGVALIALGLALSPATPGVAQGLRDCDTFEANARNLVFPVDANTRSFANGAVRFITLDTGGEPACCSAHLMVLLPDPEEPFDICRLISHRDSLGFTGLSLDRADAGYDPARGLRVAIPGVVQDGSGPRPLTLGVGVNQQTGVVTADIAPR
ncbi:hypothetical protein SAMN04488012_11031 [Palleronia salina]|uniref:Uncharacterized protein n=1 Tax=Palleronia salina TaxID=313368 RepID=A0A1M6JMC9_9RHOB|nr:hypothetical protein [Palleronia salina]SHJ47889.1 hypothetical protein SAMN04488012_11031 [Palleronia salina]